MIALHTEVGVCDLCGTGIDRKDRFCTPCLDVAQAVSDKYLAQTLPPRIKIRIYNHVVEWRCPCHLDSNYRTAGWQRCHSLTDAWHEVDYHLAVYHWKGGDE